MISIQVFIADTDIEENEYDFDIVEQALSKISQYEIGEWT